MKDVRNTQTYICVEYELDGKVDTELFNPDEISLDAIRATIEKKDARLREVIEKATEYRELFGLEAE